jgi:hypothetical protein
LRVPSNFITDTHLLIPDDYLNPENKKALYDTLVSINDLENDDVLKRIQQEKKKSWIIDQLQ